MATDKIKLQRQNYFNYNKIIYVVSLVNGALCATRRAEAK